MTKRMPIFYSALMLTGVNLLLRMVSTSFQVYISSSIGAAGVGLLQLVMSVGMLAMTAGMAGIRTATMYLCAAQLGRKKPDSVIWVLSGCFVYSILCSGSIALLLYFFAPVVAQSWIGDIRTLGAIRLFSAFLPVSCLCGVMSGYFTAAGRIGILAATEVCEQLCAMVATFLILRFWAGDDPARACQGVILGSGLGSCIAVSALVILRLQEPRQKGPRVPVAGPLIKCAVPLGASDVLRSGISTTENLMVPKRLALFHGIANPLAAFGTVCGMVFPVLMFPAAILFGLAELLIPELARCAAAGSSRRIRYLVRRSLRVAAVYGCLFAGLMYLLAQPLCQALYGNTDAGLYLKQFSLLIPMLYCDAITDAMTKGLGQQTACVRYNIITSAMDVVFLYLLLPKYAMAGYFVSFLVTHLLNFILSLRRLMKISQCTLKLRSPVFAILGTVCAVWLSSFLSAPAAQAVAFVLIFTCLLFLLRVLRKEDILWLKGLVYKK